MAKQGQNELWAWAFASLVAKARDWRYPHEQAEEMAQRAIVSAYADDPAPSDPRVFVNRAIGLMRQNAFNERRAAQRRADPRWAAPAAAQGLGLRRTPEDLVSTRELKTKLLAELFARAKGDPECIGLLEKIQEGYDTPAEQARELGIGIERVRNARKRLARLTNEIAAREARVDGVLGWDDPGKADELEEEVEG
jgi:hypothetical protein